MTRMFRTLAAALLLAVTAAPAMAAGNDETVFVRTPLMFIAALGDPTATNGDGAEDWGIWRKDPGPRGVKLENYPKLVNAGGVAPARWTFDPSAWWLEENGLIMEAPSFPLQAGKYIVTGNREVSTVLTVHPKNEDGVARWELDDGATLHDVTHLGCRSALYTPADGEGSCTPANAPKSAFRVAPGAVMPAVAGCNKQDYHVLFIVGVGIAKNSALLQ